MMVNRILFVDDEFAPDSPKRFGSYMSYYLDTLRRAGYTVVSEVSVDNAVKRLNEESFDLAIVDLLMYPGEAFADEDTRMGADTGVSLCRRIREKFPSIPILVMSCIAKGYDFADELTSTDVVTRFLQKDDTTPGQLAQIVENELKGDR